MPNGRTCANKTGAYLVPGCGGKQPTVLLTLRLRSDGPRERVTGRMVGRPLQLCGGCAASIRANRQGQGYKVTVRPMEQAEGVKI